MSRRARRSRAEAPDAAVELAAGEVRRAFEAWAARLVKLLVADYVPSVARVDWRQDATIEGLFREAGRARPRAEVLERAFTMLDKQSADELRVTGVRTADVVPKAQTRKQEWLRQNTDLIKGEADLRRRVERVLEDPLNQGRSVADVAKLLEEQAGYSTSRAVLTARDQTLKLYGQIQEERQTNAGIERYVWTTSLDERVRPDHADLDGTIQRWDDPPIVDQRTGRRGHPGFDFQCRCTAVAVLDEPAEGEAPAEQQRQVELRERAVAEGRAQVPRPPPPVQAPPRERVMVPTQAELDAERARRAAEAEQLRLEREADARIAAARAEAQRLEAERQAAQQREIERQEAEARKLEAAREAERKRLAAEAAAAEARARAEAAAARTREAERLAELERQAEAVRQAEEARAREAERAAEARRLAEAERREAARQPARDARERLKAHVNGLRIDEGVDHARLSQAADTLDRVAAPGAPPLIRLALEAASRKVQAYGVELDAAGTYSATDRFIRMGSNFKPGARSGALYRNVPMSQRLEGAYQIGAVAETAEAQFMNVLTHEYGHHVHLSASHEVDKLVAKAFSEAAPKAHARVLEARRANRAEPEPAKRVDVEGAPSAYATANHKEFFAESFTAYHEHRDWLKERKPVAYKMVEDVLALLAKKR